VSSASLLQYFSRFGEVLDCVVVVNPTTGKSRGFGFVNFKDPSCVETVVAAGPHVLDGKQVWSLLYAVVQECPGSIATESQGGATVLLPVTLTDADRFSELPETVVLVCALCPGKC